MWSRIQMPRPCVASTRSLSRGWIRKSFTGTVGRFDPNRTQCAPASIDRKKPNSVPANSRSGFFRSSCTDFTTRSAGRSPAIDVHVFPKSVDRYR